MFFHKLINYYITVLGIMYILNYDQIIKRIKADDYYGAKKA